MPFFLSSAGTSSWYDALRDDVLVVSFKEL
jgi:hypothetical protein